MANAKRQRVWSYSAGKHGVNRVRAFDRGAKGIYLEWYVVAGDTRKRERVALGHSNREQAEGQADEMAVKLRTLGQVTTKGPTLEAVLQPYLREVSAHKGGSKRKHDARCAEMFQRFFGSTFDVRTFSVRDRDHFVVERRAGRIAPAKARKARTVGDRVISYDWKFLLGALRWAHLARMLEQNPLDGLTVADEKTPARPVLRSEQYAALCKVAPNIHPLLALFLTLAHETGHRGSSIRQLRWSNVNLEAREVSWASGSDKQGFEHTTPLSDDAHAALHRAWKARASLEDGWVFPADSDTKKPWSREMATKLFRLAADKAKLPKGQRLGWHALRRQFATELKHTNLKDLAALGGWKEPTTLIRCYIAPDQETQRAALAQRKELRAAGVR